MHLRWNLAIATAAVLVACGDNSDNSDNSGPTGSETASGSAVTAGAGASTTGAGSGAHGGSGGAGGATSAGGGEASSSSAGGAGGGGGGGGGLAPNPPPNTTVCGQGLFTPAELAAGCAVPPYLQTVPPLACDAVTLDGGVWEIYCDTVGPRYLWLRIEDAASLNDCSIDLTYQNQWELAAGAYWFTGSDFGAGYIDAFANDHDFESVIANVAEPQGLVDVWLAGQRECPPDATYYPITFGGLQQLPYMIP